MSASTHEKNANTSVTASRLAALRQKMSDHRLDAYLIPSVDEHINEYLPENKQRRSWASGFTGSAGDFLLTGEEAWIFADSRYHEQADFEVDLSCVQVSKLGLNGHPGLFEKVRELAKNRSGFRLGFDPFTVTVQQAQAFEKSFEMTGIERVAVPGNLVDALWEGQPDAIVSEVYALPGSVVGQEWPEKLAALQKTLKTLKADFLPVTKLDQIAWVFNLRGQDIPYNPVFIAYAILTPEKALLFMNAERIRAKDRQALQAHNLLSIYPYTDYMPTLKAMSQGAIALIDPKHTTEGTRAIIQEYGGQIQEGEHPIEVLKAIKNETEIQRMQAANLKASRGKIRAWFWLEQQLAQGVRVTEASFRDAIEGFYAEEQDFMGLSFNTIAGAGSNGSIVHYGTPSPEKTLASGELFLIDSGCQFMGGTTDDTRTMLIGDVPTELQKLRYTEVMKAHINCAMQKFPKGTDGARLDGITRATLWQHGLDYGHGTGHGVGAFLNVHEGPNGIHRLAGKPMLPGMVNSIEPGFYEPGWGGIRLENLYFVIALEQSGFTGDWYGFESLTYIPFDKKLIDFTALSPEQLQWLRSYHQQIVERIGSTLSDEIALWLEKICAIPV